MVSSFVVAVCLQLAASQDSSSCLNNGDEHAAMVQLQEHLKKPATTRDLAHIDLPVNISLTSDLSFIIYSAVPIFGEDESYMALLSDRADKPDTYLRAHERNKLSNDDRPWTYMADNPVYCRGDWGNGENRKQVQIKGRALLCPWPAKDREKASVKVVLEDEPGRTLGTAWAKQAPGMLQKYNTIACIRDVFDEPNPAHDWQRGFSGVFKQMVEWLEFHAMSGVDHFLFYTFKGGSTDAVLEIMKPYIQKAMATRVHFDFYPWEQMVRQGFMAHDCLFRAKNHANWLMPTVDFDEYISPNFPRMKGLTHPMIFSELWDSILKTEKKKKHELHGIVFRRQRFARPSSNELEISSFWKEHGVSHLPKTVVNPDVSYQISNHYVEFHDPGTVAFYVPRSLGIIHHYRFPTGENVQFDKQRNYKDLLARVEDTSFKDLVAELEDALQLRFQLKSKDELKMFLRQMSEKHPTQPDPDTLDPLWQDAHYDD